jgi:hypothetical protein
MEQIFQISSREFRINQKNYFNLADNGARVILKRGRKQAYALTPVNEEDLFLSPELKKRIDKGLMEIKEGKGREYGLDELKAKMGL